MKRCINYACKAELEDYIEWCPYCGRFQKRSEVEMSDKEHKEKKEKLLIFTNFLGKINYVNVLLCLQIAFSILFGIMAFFPKAMWGRSFPDELDYLSYTSGVLCFINVIGFILLLFKKKTGFTIIIFSNIIGAFISIIMRVIPIGAIVVIGVIEISILWLILKIKVDGIPYWNTLK